MSRLLLALGFLCVLASAAQADGRYPSYFIPKGDVYHVRVSPSGEWVAAAMTDGERFALVAQRIGSANPRLLQTGGKDFQLSLVTWTGPDTLLARFGSGARPRWVLIRLRTTGPKGFEFDEQVFTTEGELVDGLPFSEGEVLWKVEDRLYDYVYRVSIDELIERSVELPAPLPESWTGKRVARIHGSVYRWLVDSNEVVRAALRVERNSFTTLYRAAAGERFEAIANFGAGTPDLKNPFGFTPDGSKLIVAAENKKGTIGIYEFDPVTRTVGRTIFSREGLDVEFISLDPLTRDVLSFTYSDGAETRRVYVDDARERFEENLGDFDSRIGSIHIVSSNADRTRFVFRVEDANDPGTYYFRDAPRDETVEIGKRGSTIARHVLAEMETFTVVSRDGLEIEALLTVPSKAEPGPFPLVVMPHGGPIGVHDRREYRPDVQYLASWGYAILQANYRGSSGYGRGFQEAGLREWAHGIEDDLDAAIIASVAREQIDGRRVCLVGGSYGGFSALASALRHPDWFDCAVTINGVTDVPLLGDTPEILNSPLLHSAMEEIVGDFEQDLGQLRSISPVYRASELNTPVMVVYGNRDLRVDPDHAARLLLMLELYGLDHVEYLIKDGRHSPTSDEWIRILPAIRAFLDRHMDPGTPSVQSSP